MRAHLHNGFACNCEINRSRTDAASKRPKLAPPVHRRADGDYYDFSRANEILAYFDDRDARRTVRAQLDAMAAPSPRTDARPTEAEAKARMYESYANAWQEGKR